MEINSDTRPSATLWQRINQRLSKLHAPTSPLGQALFFAATQFISYFLVVANTRAYTQADYFWTVVTDLAFGAQAFMMATIIARLAVKEGNRGLWAGLGYTLGGTLGSVTAIFLTKIWYGK